MHCLGKEDETRSPTFVPLEGIDVHPVDVRTDHCQKRDNLPVVRPHLDGAARANPLPKDVSRCSQRESLPTRKEGPSDALLLLLDSHVVNPPNTATFLIG